MSIKSQIRLPHSPLLRGYVDYYRLIHFQDEVTGSTIANGRMDMCILLQGKFEAKDEKGFQSLPAMSVFPLTRDGAHKLRISKGAVMINIKFYPHVLTRPVLENTDLSQFQSWPALFGEKASFDLLADLQLSTDNEAWLSLLDDFLCTHLLGADTDSEGLVTRTIQYIEDTIGEEPSMLAFGKSLGVSLKTLERRFKLTTGLTIKMYQDLVKFQTAVKRVRNSGRYEHGNLLEVLGVGYYDQSHFVKTCRKITGQSPKELFSKLPPDLTDFMFVGGGQSSALKAGQTES